MNEKDTAQGECIKFLKLVGRGKKNMDTIQCTRCHAKVINHTEAGVADYYAAVSGQALVIEVKDGAERFNFPDIDVEQWRWMRRYEIDAQVIGWFWLMIGVNKPNTNTDYPRKTYLVTRSVLSQVRRVMIHKGGVNNLPANALAARTRIQTRDLDLHAERLLKNYRCDWYGDHLWLPCQEHSFWPTYKKNWSDYASTVGSDSRTQGKGKVFIGRAIPLGLV